MVFDFEKAIEDRKETRAKKEHRGIERPKEKYENKYFVYLDIENQENFLQDAVEADNPTEALFKAISRAKEAGKKIIEENCRAKDLKTGELFSIDGRID